MFEAYHGVTGAQHQAKVNSLSAQGFRMISLSVYGDPGDARYAAVWVQRSGAAWVAVHGVDSAGYQSFFNNWTAKGYAPVLVSATGAISNAIFAAVFEQGIHGAWLARHGMTSGPEANVGTFQNLNKAAAGQKMILRSVTIYWRAEGPAVCGRVARQPRIREVARLSIGYRRKLPGGLQCGNAVGGVPTGGISPCICSSFR
jgi:hypothetical protein